MNIDDPSACAAEIAKEYAVKDGVILSPGKFEGKPAWAPYYWSVGLEGFARDDIAGVWTFQVDRDEREAFPGLEDVLYVALEETGGGFVNSRSFTSEHEFTSFVESLYRDSEDDSEAVANEWPEGSGG